jgi:group I intron endonuclease
MVRRDAGAQDWSPFVGVIYGVRLLGSPEYRYVGMTTKTITRRKSEHFKVADSGRKTPFADWLRKRADREEAFFDSLELVMSDELADLGEAERRWIDRLRQDGHRLLNLNEGGLGNHGYVWTEEQRQAAAERMRGQKRPDYPSGPDHPRWGTTWTDEQRARISEKRKGMNSGQSNANFGKFGSQHPSFGHTMSTESRARLAEARRGEKNPNFGKTASAETRAKRSAAMKGRPMPSSVRSAHTRHHTNKGVFKDTCRHCHDDLGMPTQEEEQE